MEISRAQIQLVRSLQRKKDRDEQGLFVAEGPKCVGELRGAFVPYLLVDSHDVSALQMEQMSAMKTPQGVIGVFRLPKKTVFPIPQKPEERDMILVLDGVQDPGNMGTIIRTADWFGVRDIVASEDTADCFGPKVVQATMGALARVRVHYTDIELWLRGYRNAGGRIYGTLLEGETMYAKVNKTKGCAIVMGNEGNGIRPAIRALVTDAIRIPSYPENADTSESLNVGVATAIVLAEMRRPKC